MYRTGDRGLLREDGSLVLLGRMDRELKLRGEYPRYIKGSLILIAAGFHIAPEEVEKAIMGSDTGFAEASVHLSEDGLALEAFVAPFEPSIDELATALKSNIPTYMVPSTFHSFNRLPKNTSGKIDHKAVPNLRIGLKRPEFPERKDSLVDPQDYLDDYSEMEESDDKGTVAEIWKTVLGLSKTPRTDVNFFDIGGHRYFITA